MLKLADIYENPFKHQRSRTAILFTDGSRNSRKNDSPISSATIKMPDIFTPKKGKSLMKDLLSLQLAYSVEGKLNDKILKSLKSSGKYTM